MDNSNDIPTPPEAPAKNIPTPPSVARKSIPSPALATIVKGREEVSNKILGQETIEREIIKLSKRLAALSNWGTKTNKDFSKSLEKVSKKIQELKSKII